MVKETYQIRENLLRAQADEIELLKKEIARLNGVVGMGQGVFSKFPHPQIDDYCEYVATRKAGESVEEMTDETRDAVLGGLD